MNPELPHWMMKSMRILLPALLLLVSLPLGAATGRIFVSNERSDSLSVIDSATNTVIATIKVGKRPRGVGLAPDGSEVYVAVSGDNAIAVVDPQTMKVLRTFSSGDDPEAFAVHPNGNHLHLQRRRRQGLGVQSAHG